MSDRNDAYEDDEGHVHKVLMEPNTSRMMRDDASVDVPQLPNKQIPLRQQDSPLLALHADARWKLRNPSGLARP